MPLLGEGKIPDAVSRREDPTHPWWVPGPPLSEGGYPAGGWVQPPSSPHASNGIFIRRGETRFIITWWLNCNVRDKWSGQRSLRPRQQFAGLLPRPAGPVIFSIRFTFAEKSSTVARSLAPSSRDRARWVRNPPVRGISEDGQTACYGARPPRPPDSTRSHFDPFDEDGMGDRTFTVPQLYEPCLADNQRGDPNPIFVLQV